MAIDYPLSEVPVSPEEFKKEVLAWAARIGVQVKEIHIRPMKRKWASCSRRGRVTFSKDLLEQPAAFRTRAIVHELVHLKVPNHGRFFKILVESFLSSPLPN